MWRACSSAPAVTGGRGRDGGRLASFSSFCPLFWFRSLAYQSGFLFMKDRLVRIVKGCSRRKDGGRRETWQQAERSGPFPGQLENLELMPNRTLHLTSLCEGFVGSESPLY